MGSFLQLIKYKLCSAVSLSAVLGWFLANGGIDGSAIILIAGVFCLAAASSAFNQYQERKYDALMERTQGRPIPSGKIHSGKAIALSLLLLLMGVFLLYLLGIIPMILGISNLILYNLLYTPLKRITSFAIIPGGLVGALPPMIGWTAAGGAVLHPTILFVCTLMFLWQVPHFWLLIMRYGKEYEAAGFKTVKIYLNDTQIRRLIFVWISLSSLFLLTFPLFQIQISWWLLISLIIMNGVVISVFARLLFRKVSRKQEKWLFIGTNVFLTLVFIAFILNAIL